MARTPGNLSGLVNRTRTTPVPVQRTSRVLRHRVLTSLPAGKMVPIMAIPLLREDSLSMGRYQVSFEMSETVEILANSVNVRLMAYLVPKLAFERYDGLDALNKSYEGVPLQDGDPVTPWFEPFTVPDPFPPILAYMGKHAKTGAVVNTDMIEAYNAIWNFRAKNRSKDITLRTRLDTSLAPAFWLHQTFAHIVPDFDQAVIDGEVPLNMTGPGLAVVPDFTDPVGTRLETAPGVPALGGNLESRSTSQSAIRVAGGGENIPTYAGYGMMAVFDELAGNGITVSLSNIEMARKTQAFANLRRQYSGHSDEWIINLLMDGISLPQESWKQPMLLADESTVFGMSKRYATDSSNLTESVVNGMTAIDLKLNVPRCPTGGIVMICAEISPEQLFERQKDPYLFASSVDDLPQFLRDTLDPEKVVVVTNDEVDIDHDTPTATFGYAPLNHEWARSIPQVGGKFRRPAVDEAFDEDRQRIWAVETANPVLSEDFYLCTTMHYKPFVVTDLAIDPFEALLRGESMIRGNTVFGGLLVEAEGDYEAVLAQAPTDRIQKPAPAAEAAAEPAGDA